MDKAKQEPWPATPPETMRAAEVVARAIVADIGRDGLEPGAHLPPEAAMIERYGVGRGSVREAIRLLESQGLVELRRGRSGGAAVGAVSAERLGRVLALYLRMQGTTYGELADMMLVLGPQCAALAAARTDRDFVREQLDATGGGWCEVCEDTVLSQPAAHDFHRTINHLSGNGALSLLADAIDSLFTHHVVIRLSPFDNLDRVYADHHAIATAVLVGDPDRAREEMTRHIAYIVETFKAQAPGIGEEVVDWL